MSDSLRPLARPRLYEQVVARLREYVQAESLQTGDRLPPERDLADQLGVSRTSVRQAIVALEVQGLVEVRHGGGTFLLRDRLDAEPLEVMIDRRQRLPDVLDARDALETKLAALAAVRRTDNDLTEIDAALAAMSDAVHRGELGVTEDQRFHAASPLRPAARCWPPSWRRSRCRSPRAAPSHCANRAVPRSRCTSTSSSQKPCAPPIPRPRPRHAYPRRQRGPRQTAGVASQLR